MNPDSSPLPHLYFLSRHIPLRNEVSGETSWSIIFSWTVCLRFINTNVSLSIHISYEDQNTFPQCLCVSGLLRCTRAPSLETSLDAHRLPRHRVIDDKKSKSGFASLVLHLVRFSVQLPLFTSKGRRNLRRDAPSIHARSLMSGLFDYCIPFCLRPR